MPKVTGPLLSQTAQGHFGHLLIYDRRGFARAFRAPSNRRTPKQGNIRQRLLATDRVIKKAGRIPRDIIQNISPRRAWHQWFVSIVLGDGEATWLERQALYLALADKWRDGWEGEASASGLIATHLNYASDPPISPGLALWEFCYALWSQNGDWVGFPFEDVGTHPTERNYVEWGFFYRWA